MWSRSCEPGQHCMLLLRHNNPVVFANRRARCLPPAPTFMSGHVPGTHADRPYHKNKALERKIKRRSESQNGQLLLRPANQRRKAVKVPESRLRHPFQTHFMELSGPPESTRTHLYPPVPTSTHSRSNRAHTSVPQGLLSPFFFVTRHRDTRGCATAAFRGQVLLGEKRRHTRSFSSRQRLVVALQGTLLHLHPLSTFPFATFYLHPVELNWTCRILGFITCPTDPVMLQNDWLGQ